MYVLFLYYIYLHVYKRSDHAGGFCIVKQTMTGNEINFIVEQRAHTKIRVLLGYSATDIKHDLDKVYGTSALSYPTILLLFHLLSI